MNQYRIDAEINKQQLEAMLDDPAWWAEKGICLRAAEAVEGDLVCFAHYDRYSMTVDIFRVTKVARKWRTILNEDGRWPREDRFFINEFTHKAQIDPGNGVGNARFVYGQIDWELDRADSKAISTIAKSGLKFDYGSGKTWGPEQRIQLSEFLREIGVVPS